MPDGSLKKSGTESKEISGTLCCANDGSADNMRIETHTHNFIGGLLGLNARALLLATYTLNHGNNKTEGLQRTYRRSRWFDILLVAWKKILAQDGHHETLQQSDGDSGDLSGGSSYCYRVGVSTSRE